MEDKSIGVPSYSKIQSSILNIVNSILNIDRFENRLTCDKKDEYLVIPLTSYPFNLDAVDLFWLYNNLERQFKIEFSSEVLTKNNMPTIELLSQIIYDCCLNKAKNRKGDNKD